MAKHRRSRYRCLDGATENYLPRGNCAAVVHAAVTLSLERHGADRLVTPAPLAGGERSPAAPGHHRDQDAEEGRAMVRRRSPAYLSGQPSVCQYAAACTASAGAQRQGVARGVSPGTPMKGQTRRPVAATFGQAQGSAS